MTPLAEKQIEDFVAAFPGAQRDVAMHRQTYLKIGGPARLFLSSDDSEEIVEAIRKAMALDIPYAMLGGGSNVLIADSGFEGVILQSTDRSIEVEGVHVTAAAGAITGLVARKSVDAGLTGFEWGVGVPGSIGGAVYGNAGCFGGETKDAVSSVRAYSIENDEIRDYSNAECEFGYRESRFKCEPHFILSATLELARGDQNESRKQMDDIVAKRKATQPQGSFSAGCLFKNHEATSSVILSEVEGSLFQEKIPSEFITSGKIPAGWLIDQCGLKGTRVGDAEVSDVHANFIVNRGKATAEDIHGLFELIQKSVQEKTGIRLQNEVQFLGFDS